MPSLSALKEFIAGRNVDYSTIYGPTYWNDGSVNQSVWSLDGSSDWERIEESPEAVTEPPQHVYAYLAAQYGIVIIADGVTYDGAKK